MKVKLGIFGGAGRSGVLVVFFCSTGPSLVGGERARGQLVCGWGLALFWLVFGRVGYLNF